MIFDRNLDNRVSTVPSEVHQQLFEYWKLPSDVRLNPSEIRRIIGIIPCSHLKSMIATSRSRAAKKEFDFDFTLEHLISIWTAQRGKCAISKVLLEISAGTLTDKNPYKVSIDRINNNEGYILSNIRLVTHFVNNAKSTYDNETFFEMIENIHRNRSRKESAQGWYDDSEMDSWV